MKILITGATGFVGKILVPKLLKDNNQILEITVQPEVSKSVYGNNTTQFHFDYSRQAELVNVVNEFKPEYVIHLASYLTASDAFADMKKLLDANVVFLCHILDAVKEASIKWFINTGSFAEYFKGNGQLDPAYLYTATKTASRIFVDYYSKVFKFNYITVAPYTIYGGKDTQKKIIDIIYDSLDNETEVDLTPGSQILDFIHVEDVTDFYVKLINNLYAMESESSIHLGTGIGHTLRELVSIMEKKTNKTASINWGGKQYRPRDVMYAVADTSLQKKIMGWNPRISLEEGVDIYLKQKIEN